MNEDRRIGESAPREPGPRAPVSWLRRLAALLALIALLASAAVSSWWILTNQADFSASGARSSRPDTAAAQREGKGD